jgi:outer membrane protein assembly factor BamB
MRLSPVIIAMLLFGSVPAAAAGEPGVDLSWRWDEVAARNLDSFHPVFEVSSPDGGRFVFSSGDWKPSRVRRLDSRGAVVWSRIIRGLPTRAAAMVLNGDTLYAALYNGSSSGCRVAAFDARSGARRWETQLEGVGFVAHSAYGNRVQMQLTPNGLVIYGNEWRGRYVEALDPAHGRQLGHRRLEPEPPESKQGSKNESK